MHRLVALALLLVTCCVTAFPQQGASTVSSVAAAPWEFIGPTNIGGRVLSVAVNPQNSGTIYAGTAGNGLWRSRTAGHGGNWQRISLGLSVVGIGAIAIDPADSNTIYVGTGEVYSPAGAVNPNLDRITQGSNGYGILKSTNGGLSWSQSLAWDPSQMRAVSVLRMNPQNSATLFAGTTDGLYHTTNAGATWSRVLDSPWTQDIVINHDDTTLVMATAGLMRSPGQGAFLSLDGGFEFFQLESFPVFNAKARLEAYAGDGNVVFATVATDSIGRLDLWKTTDFGATWDTVRRVQDFALHWYSQFVAVHPQYMGTIAMGSATFTITSDGGQTMIQSPGPGSMVLTYAHDPSNNDRLYVVGEGGIFVTDDFGYNFTSLNAGLVTAQINSGLSNSETDPNFAVGSSQSGIGVVYTGSTAWGTSEGQEAGWTVISPANDSVIYRGSPYGTLVYRSVNRGLSYNAGTFLGTPGGPGGGFFVFEPTCWNAPMLAARVNPSTLYVAKTKMYRSVDAAETWNAISGILDGNFPTCMAMTRNGTDTIYVGTAPTVTAAHIMRSTNGGAAWVNVTATLPNRFPLDLAVDPFDAAVVYAAYDGYGNGHLFKSTNAGGSWTDISASLPDAPISAVVVDPLSSAMVYAAGDDGVYVSTDGGSTWTSMANALPEAYRVADLVISPANRKLRLVTRGAGVFQHDLYSPTSATVSVDLRGSWNLISLPVNAINTTPGALYPTTLPGTLFRYDGQYIAATELEPGKAYWAKFPAGTTAQQVSGPALTSVTVSVKKGWNLVGTIGVEVPAPTGGIIESSWYEFTPGGYAVAATLKPGHGYWLKASAAGTVTITIP